MSWRPHRDPTDSEKRRPADWALPTELDESKAEAINLLELAYVAAHAPGRAIEVPLLLNSVSHRWRSLQDAVADRKWCVPSSYEFKNPIGRRAGMTLWRS